MDKIQVWGTSKDGEGYVQDLGIYDNLEDISIRTSILADNVLITLEWVNEDEK